MNRPAAADWRDATSAGAADRLESGFIPQRLGWDHSPRVSVAIAPQRLRFEVGQVNADYDRITRSLREVVERTVEHDAFPQCLGSVRLIDATCGQRRAFLDPAGASFLSRLALDWPVLPMLLHPGMASTARLALAQRREILEPLADANSYAYRPAQLFGAVRAMSSRAMRALENVAERRGIVHDADAVERQCARIFESTNLYVSSMLTVAEGLEPMRRPGSESDDATGTPLEIEAAFFAAAAEHLAALGPAGRVRIVSTAG